MAIIRFQGIWGTSTPGIPSGSLGELAFPKGIAHDASGNMYVMDSGNDRIQKFTGGGQFLDSWGGIHGDGPLEFNQAEGIAVDSNFNIYVADSFNNRVQKIDRNGTFIKEWGGAGNDDGEFNHPRGITVDFNDNVLVVDSGNSRIQKFTSDGEFLDDWGSFGSGNGQFGESVYGICVDSNNNFYVVEDGNPGRVQKFDSNGNFMRLQLSSGYLGITSIFNDVTLQNGIILISSQSVFHWTFDMGAGSEGTFDTRINLPKSPFSLYGSIRRRGGAFPVINMLHITDNANHVVKMYRWEREVQSVQSDNSQSIKQEN